MRIIYKDEAGCVAVIMPAPACKRSIKEIAEKDVPPGLPYKIVEDDAIPSDLTFRDAWEVDESLLTDGVGAESNEFPESGAFNVQNEMEKLLNNLASRHEITVDLEKLRQEIIDVSN
jgi:hypothetical protein